MVLGKKGILVSLSPDHTKVFPLFCCGGVGEKGNERLLSPLKIHAPADILCLLAIQQLRMGSCRRISWLDHFDRAVFEKILERGARSRTALAGKPSKLIFNVR